MEFYMFLGLKPKIADQPIDFTPTHTVKKKYSAEQGLHSGLFGVFQSSAFFRGMYFGVES